MNTFGKRPYKIELINEVCMQEKRIEKTILLFLKQSRMFCRFSVTSITNIITIWKVKLSEKPDFIIKLWNVCWFLHYKII